MRTTLAVVFGVLALWLLIAGVVVLWLNRTVTSTDTYVATVEPLSRRSEVKDFVIAKVNEQLEQSVSGTELAALTLPIAERVGMTDTELKAAALATINETLLRSLDSEAFQNLWSETNRSAHRQLVAQLESDSDTASFNMGPAVIGALRLLQDSQLSPLIGRLDLPPTKQFEVTLQSENLKSVRNAYSLFKQGTILLIVLAAVCLMLAVILSVHHIKTLRRIIIGSGVGLLLIWLCLLFMPGYLAGSTDPGSQALTEAVADVLIRDLRRTTFIAGILCISIGVISELHDTYKHRRSRQS